MLEKNILKYWYDMEFFSPTTPNINKYTQYLRDENDKIKWVECKDYILTYDVYIGISNVDELIAYMVKNTNIERIEEIEKNNTKCCLCGIRVNSNKEFVSGTFSISPFMYAIGKLAKEGTLDVNFKDEEIQKINSEINSYIKPGLKATEQELYNMYVATMEVVNLKPELVNFQCTINCRKLKKKELAGSNSEQDETGNILESFYTQDLKEVMDKFTENDRIYEYIGALQIDENNKPKVEIESNVAKLRDVLLPDKYPLGKWPSKYTPTLMQQVAINCSIDSKIKTFSVNGPPGTGKTTLIKEIIASYVVDRALELSKFTNPDDAFILKEFSLPCSKYRYFYEPNANISNYGIMVVSNNNKAVENITLKLPERREIKETLTQFFEEEYDNDIYFSKIAENLLENNEKCWGLISARLGNKNNINKFNNVMWYNSNSIRDTKEVADWNLAKKEYLECYSEVMNYRENIMKAITDVKEFRRNERLHKGATE